MNILHLARTMGQGGAEKFIYQLASGCKQNGNKLVVVSCGGVYVKPLKDKGIHHYEVQDLECKDPVVILQTLKKLVKIIRKERIQIIHSHHRMAALYGRILKFIFPKIRLVYTAHNVFYDKKLLTKLALSDTKVVAVGEAVRQNLTEVFQIKDKKIEIILNAVKIGVEETRQVHPLLNELKEKGYTLIGVIGRLSEQKGIDVFIRAMKHIIKEYPSVRGIIIGDGEQREELQSLVCKCHLENKVYFLGYQEHVTGMIKQLDFAAMPSRWEGFPLTPIELFAMEKTLVASDIGGINEIVEHGKNGLLIPKDDVKLLCRAIKELLDNKALRQVLETNGRRDYEKKYSYQSLLNHYLQLYKDILM